MIDYEIRLERCKREETKELMIVCLNKDGLLTVRHSKHDGTNYYFEYMSDDIITKRKGYYTECIDDLIINLKKITHPEPKYKVGDKVWVLDSKGGLHISTIKSTNDGLYTIAGHADLIYTEEDLYPSREALIKSQIEYWTSLKKEEKSTGSVDVSIECEHKSDGRLHPGNHEIPSSYVCKKCGEFYR